MGRSRGAVDRSLRTIRVVAGATRRRACWGVDSEHGRLLDVLALPSRQLSLAADERDLAGDAGGAAGASTPPREGASTPRSSGPTKQAGVRVPLPGARRGAAVSGIRSRLERDDHGWGGDHAAPAVWRRGEYAAAIRFYQEAEIPIRGMITAGALEGGDVMILEPAAR